MPILPVWLQGWELGGGDVSARVGEPWDDGTLVIHTIEDWSHVSSGDLGWKEVGDGRVHFVAEAVPHPTGVVPGTVLEFGGCRISAPGFEALGLIEGEGTILSDSHAYYDPEVTTRGRVRRLAIRPQILEQVDERTFAVTGYGPPTDIEATSDVEFRSTHLAVVM